MLEEETSVDSHNVASNSQLLDHSQIEGPYNGSNDEALIKSVHQVLFLWWQDWTFLQIFFTIFFPLHQRTPSLNYSIWIFIALWCYNSVKIVDMTHNMGAAIPIQQLVKYFCCFISRLLWKYIIKKLEKLTEKENKTKSLSAVANFYTWKNNKFLNYIFYKNFTINFKDSTVVAITFNAD